MSPSAANPQMIVRIQDVRRWHGMSVTQVLLWGLSAYAAGSALVALRLAWHMVTRLDRFDWHFYRTEIWAAFAIIPLLWLPIVVRSPRTLVDVGELLSPKGGYADHARTEHQLWHNPPPCGASVAYAADDGDGVGIVTIRSADLERLIVSSHGSSPDRRDGDAAAVLRWLRARDRYSVSTTPVPSGWRNFKFLANDALRLGLGHVHCRSCRADYQPRDLATVDDEGRPGWNRTRLKCPRGHLLLDLESIHLSIRADD